MPGSERARSAGAGGGGWTEGERLRATRLARGVLETSVGALAEEGSLSDMGVSDSGSEDSVRLRLPRVEWSRRGVGEVGALPWALPLFLGLERFWVAPSWRSEARMAASLEALAMSSW
jgi:hypothetical protein